MKYIVAVSGGVDSVVLLDRLFKEKRHELVVAHVNHGIRESSHEDETLTRELAEKYGLAFESIRLVLGNASEETARIHRHAWLRQVLASHSADAIATAHHQDDVLETMCINMVRGTGWRGLCSLRSHGLYIRPLLAWDKVDIVTYAIGNNLSWVEDGTNGDVRYLRNYLRHGIVARLDPNMRQALLDINSHQLELREEIEKETEQLLGKKHQALDRYRVIMLDEPEAGEILRAWLGESLTRERLQDLWIFSKTAKVGARWSLGSERFVVATQRQLIATAARD